MKRFIAAILLSLPLLASAAGADILGRPLPEPVPGKPVPQMCEKGLAPTYTVQCDPGTRLTALDINQRTPGVAICRALFHGCSPIIGWTSPAAAPEHQVLDTFYGGELISVTFGMTKLMDQNN